MGLLPHERPEEDEDDVHRKAFKAALDKLAKQGNYIVMPASSPTVEYIAPQYRELLKKYMKHVIKVCDGACMNGPMPDFTDSQIKELYQIEKEILNP